MVVRAGCRIRDYPFANQRPFSLRPADLATVAHFNRDGGRPVHCAVHPMSWRWLPPVYSPVSRRALLRGVGAACGWSDARDAMTAADALKRRFGATDVLLTDSGTSALILAIQAVVPPGGSIALPGYACVDLTSAAVGANVKVRLYDLDPATLSPDLESVRRVMERGVDAIVVAHLHGYPADIHAVQALASAHGIEVIEDAAQAAGGTLNGARLGSIGDIGVLSFGRGKGMTAGTGGALLVRTPSLEAWMRRARAELDAPRRGGREIVWLAAQWILARPSLYRVPAAVPRLKLGEMVYKPPKPPRAMCRTATAILLEALGADSREVRARCERASSLISAIDGQSRLRPIRAIPGGKPGFLRLALLDDTGHCAPVGRAGAVRGYPLSLDQHEQLRPLLLSGERAGDGSAFLRDRLFTIPTHSRVANSDVVGLLDWLVVSPRTSRGDAREGSVEKEWQHA